MPATLSRVIINVNDRVGGDNRAVALHAGLVGIAQDDDGALRPVAGWHLTPAAPEIEDVIARIRQDHVTEPPQPAPRLRMLQRAADLGAMDEAMSAATLFDGGWWFLPAGEERIVWRSGEPHTIETVFDLADGRSIATAADHESETLHWVICRVEPIGTEDEPEFRLVDDPADIPVRGTSLAFLLDAALDSGGDVAHLETGRLADLEG